MLLTSRKLIQRKLMDVECDMRGTLRNFGLKVGTVSPAGYEGRIRESVLPSQRKRLLFPGTSDECRHFHRSIICPQDAQHLSPVVYVEPVGQVRFHMLPRDRVSIAW